MPAVRPSASHHRPSPVRSSFTANKQISIHASRSYVAVDTRCPTPSRNPDTAAHTAARSCPRRELPNSRAINATTMTVIAEASVDTTRSPIGVLPNTKVETCASNGVSGGWSTYPQSSFWPATMK
jgi:hypothetical protein